MSAQNTPAIDSWPPEWDVVVFGGREYRLPGARAAAAGRDRPGRRIVSPHGEQRRPRFDVPAIDSTGAGDAFAGAVAFGLARGLPWDDIGKMASASAALKTCSSGRRRVCRRSIRSSFRGESGSPDEARTLRQRLSGRPGDPSVLPRSVPVATGASFPGDPTQTSGDPGAPTG